MLLHLIKIKYSFVCILFLLCFLQACQGDETEVSVDPTPYHLHTGSLPPPFIPLDNPLTEQGVLLGRMLFYDKVLSGDGTISCADCHQQKDMFSDIRQFSEGVEGRTGNRQAMALFNLAWHAHGLFWDGRARTLREQALHPIQDTLEMNQTLDQLVDLLQAKQEYRDQFTRAFGTSTITPERIGLAIEQFEMSIVSYDSKYDRYLKGQAILTPEEERGRQLYFANSNLAEGQKGGECVHCHGGPNFTSDFYVNNGLDREIDFTDLGRYHITGLDSDKAVFKVPSLRNIALTPPYMHDGRFATLEEVVEHYNSGVKPSSTTHHSMGSNLQHGGLQLSAQDKSDLVAFMRTLTDEGLKTDERYQTPF